MDQLEKVDRGVEAVMRDTMASSLYRLAAELRRPPKAIAEYTQKETIVNAQQEMTDKKESKKRAGEHALAESLASGKRAKKSRGGTNMKSVQLPAVPIVALSDGSNIASSLPSSASLQTQSYELLARLKKMTGGGEGSVVITPTHAGAPKACGTCGKPSGSGATTCWNCHMPF